MPPVVIDASAGAEIVTDTRRGQALSRLLQPNTEGWVPEHFYAEVLGLIRRRTVVKRDLSETEGAEAVRRLGAWRLHRASIRPTLVEAWSYRHNMTAARWTMRTQSGRFIQTIPRSHPRSSGRIHV